ncbi:DsbA family protein [Noviherbaspirillum aridicola]|uniref:DsbA family protein n=1 Tax=Noviherbaspirillum aridicola TaxID=2849687 RepID=A0ABQ4PYT4_9BURK|nr:DsbA family protein [Noviherbaspirillum aridicola]GIZ50019.1 DsbA family protein [Noviherbaspirillum aridicola]
MASLIYIADPMCAWCYGITPELEALREALPGLPVHVVAGGLRVGAAQVDEAYIDRLRGQWQEVAARAALPFDDRAVTTPGFNPDTEAACRAVVAARLLSPAAALPVCSAILRAFHAEGRDVTRPQTLAAIAVPVLRGLGVETDEAAFLERYASDETARATLEDFLQTRRWGVDGFPALVLERDGRLDLVSLGYRQLPQLVDTMLALVEAEAAPAE